MRLLDLFAGLGGFSIAAHRVGIETAAFVEINPFCRRVLAARFPGVPIFEDVREVTAESLRAAGVGPISACSFGFPCQDLSVAGQRAGLSGERSGLFWEACRIVDAVRPDWIIAENVPGLRSSNEGRDMAAVVGAFAELGYVGAWRSIDAQFFGLAQRRERVFFVGGLGDAGRRAVHAVLEGGKRYPAPRRTTGQAAPTIPSRSSAGGGLGTDFDCDGGLIPILEVGGGTSSRGEGPNGTGIGAAGDPMFTLQRGKQHAIAFAQNQRDEVRDLNDCAGALAAEPGMKQQSYVAFSWDEEINGNTEIAGSILRGGEGGRHEGVAIVPAVAFTERGRDGGRNFECQEELAYALTNPGAGSRTQDRQVAKGSQVRRLSPTEAERLQGFSWRDETGEWQDGHSCLCGKNRGRSFNPNGGEVCTCKDGARYRALGNAVAVPCVEWLWRAILAADER